MVDRFKRLSGRRPLAAALLVTVVVFLVSAVAAVAAVGLLGRDPLDASVQIVGQVVAIAAVLLLCWRMGWLAAAGITRLGAPRIWVVTSLIVAYTGVAALLAFFGTLGVDASLDGAAAPDLVHTTLAGVMEELLLRGLVLYVLVAGWGAARWGAAAGVLVSALLFGGLHFLNLTTGNADVTTAQAAESFLSGIVYGTLVLIGGSVWPAVAIHGLINLLVNAVAANTAGFEATAGDYLAFLALQAPVVLGAAVMLARRHPAPR